MSDGLRAARRERAADRELERRLRRQLRDLEVDPPLTVEALCDAVSRKRGREILLRPHPLPVPGPQGLWLETRTCDVIVYQERTTPMHRRHIILHEVMGHIYGAHKSDAGNGGFTVPGLNDGAVRQALARCAYDDDQECEAEKAATIVTAWAFVLDEVAPTASGHPELRRVHSAIGDHRGWL
ncbi:hypothetical protein [Streptomyces sp. NPDC050504]|uniref:hypothetical protein n=1 Tax=Streptomyces sp. NPDC050504 TaxID=3365618 RepID=UPI0037A78DB1